MIFIELKVSKKASNLKTLEPNKNFYNHNATINTILFL